jgi:hypothetical protein
MKKAVIIAALALTTAVGARAQGTVQFNNGIAGTLITHVYAPNSANVAQIGNGSNDTPSGPTSWAGFTFVGAAGVSGVYGGSTTFAQLLAANGGGQAESSLVPATPTTTFRTGTAGGRVTGVTATLTGVAIDAASATIEMVAWDNSSGLYPTWSQASVAWQNALIAAGKSGTFTVNAIGGGLNPPPVLSGLQSFSMYIIPEPTSMALVGLGAAAALIFRRRK